ncbi:hypothetical protein T4D_13698 [Trichinella pseudospiralis]|uniref:Uncharacterized protein n=1 Tax=Trichinella pseudospiralis TaxID=6337 RepID=A0A0V1DMJ5_TRIPS|nr:hypothetical protein T4D_13698 [Trichinella pseudospiralis]
MHSSVLCKSHFASGNLNCLFVTPPTPCPPEYWYPDSPASCTTELS